MEDIIQNIFLVLFGGVISLLGTTFYNRINERAKHLKQINFVFLKLLDIKRTFNSYYEIAKYSKNELLITSLDLQLYFDVNYIKEKFEFILMFEVEDRLDFYHGMNTLIGLIEYSNSVLNEIYCSNLNNKDKSLKQANYIIENKEELTNLITKLEDLLVILDKKING